MDQSGEILLGGEHIYLERKDLKQKDLTQLPTVGTGSSLQTKVFAVKENKSYPTILINLMCHSFFPESFIFFASLFIIFKTVTHIFVSLLSFTRHCLTFIYFCLSLCHSSLSHSY